MSRSPAPSARWGSACCSRSSTSRSATSSPRSTARCRRQRRPRARRRALRRSCARAADTTTVSRAVAHDARDRPDELERGREAYATRAWLQAYASLERADGWEPLDPPDLELLSVVAFMLGRDDDTVTWLERAHLAHLDRGETLPAVRCAAWIGLNLASRGEIGP